MTLDAGIPLLTEIIADPATLDGSANAVPAPPSIPGFLLKENISQPAADKFTQAQLEKLEREISEKVLQDMLGNVDFILEQQIRDSLTIVLEDAMGSLVTEIRQGLQDTLESVVTLAVAQEITKLQSSKK